MMKKNLKDSEVNGVTSTTKMKEDLKPTIDYQNTALTKPEDIIFALDKNVKSFSLKELCDESFEEALNPIAYARLIGAKNFSELYVLNFYTHYPKKNIVQVFSVMFLDYERAEFRDVDINYIAECGWYYDDEWTPKPIRETMAYRNKISYYKKN